MKNAKKKKLTWTKQINCRAVIEEEVELWWVTRNKAGLTKPKIPLQSQIENITKTYFWALYNGNASAVITPVEVVREGQISFANFLDNYNAMKGVETHIQLQNNLIKHQWEIKGHEDDI